MTETVFFAWQSDLPRETNHKFIRTAIDSALGVINAGLSAVEAIRSTEGTEGVPGDINVAETIFSKIDDCRIFVADVTTVTPPGAERPAPNPNVMVEYGRASVRPGSARVVTVFNSAFGDWKTDRPFDLRHRRMPVVYNLPASHSARQHESVQRRLTSDLVEVFEAVLAVPVAPAKVTTIQDFEELRTYYFETPFKDSNPPRTPGFWCGALAAPSIPSLKEPWRHSDLAHREPVLNCRVGSSSVRFETMDSEMWMRGDDLFEPRPRGACRLHRIRYHNHDAWMEDVITLNVTDTGNIVLAARTGNVRPAPLLNMRWILADAANVLRSLHRVRRYLACEAAPYSMLVELRYDQRSANAQAPVPQGNWRLASIEDETGHHYWAIGSQPMQIGPIDVTSVDSFPNVLNEIYVGLMTSAHQVPQDSLTFDLGIR